MQLIGMLDSPYVRRVAISFATMGIPFEHKAVSVLSTFEQFQAINPVVKAPTLVCDDGELLMDSSLMLEYAEVLAPAERHLVPRERGARQHALCLIGLALAACEKSVQIVYERHWRPPEMQYRPWLDRIQGQMLAAYSGLEAALCKTPIAAGVSQASITAAVAWQFSQSLLSDLLPPATFPALQGLSDESEQLPHFVAYPPIGPGVTGPGRGEA